MTDQFLHKPVRKPSLDASTPRKTNWSTLLGLMAVSAVLFGASLALNSNVVYRNLKPAERTTLAVTSQDGSRHLFEATKTCEDYRKRLTGTPYVENGEVKFKKDSAPLFPFIVDYKEYNCPPALWDRYIIADYVFRVLGILNYAAGAACIILTVLAGIYYMLGFASEQNVKKGKTILIGTYIGFLIVIMARLIVGSSLLVSSGEANFSSLPVTTTQ